ncbi:hypothetical protein AB0M94_37320 [Streptomyces xanthochromogenes]|uniref:hypothetical protein n=1 Tax=Streptomyces xanthochromogenes TaxID=67384 RepID=UPI003413A882
MKMIYAFRDQEGTWHGDPDAAVLGPAPGYGPLTYNPPPGSPASVNPFTGQTLHVLYADTHLELGPVHYLLDTGVTLPASWHVHELLAAPYEPRTAAPATARAAQR